MDYQKTVQDAAYKYISIHYLFSTLADAYTSQADVGYTHLMLGNLKNNKSFATILAKKVKRDFPDYYEKCIKCARDLNIQTRPTRYILLTTFDKGEEVSLLEPERIIQKDDASASFVPHSKDR
jgi:hypothetical protein